MTVSLNHLFRGAVAAALVFAATAANAVNLSSDGNGEALIYPYYSVRGGQVTLVSVVNNDSRSKALNVVFREARNATAVLEFNLFLSNSDVWTAAIVADASGGAKLISSDASCTNPRIPTAGVSFSNVGYASDSPSFRSLDRTTEGYFEIVELASIVSKSAIDIDVTQNGSGERTCLLVSNSSVVARQSEFEAPRGKLSGTATLVSRSMSTGYSALALQGLHIPVTSMADSRSFYVLGLANARSKTAFITHAAPKRTYTIFAEFDRSIDAISAVLMQDKVRGEFSKETGFATDFVMTFPTKFFYANAGNAGTAGNPFTSRWNPDTGAACEVPDGPNFRSREQGVPGFFDGAMPRTTLCFSTTTLSFVSSGTSSPLGSSVRAEIVEPPAGIEPRFRPVTGTASLGLGRGTQPDLLSNANSRVIVTESGAATREINGAVKFSGLPVIGIVISTLQATNTNSSFNSSYALTGSRALPE